MTYEFSAPRAMNHDSAQAWERVRYQCAKIPDKDVDILMKVKQNAKSLDASHKIGPLKFGKASITGLLPVVGDFADVLLAYWDIYRVARKISKGDDITAFKRKMKVRFVYMGCVGSIPVIGGLANVVMAWNVRNAASLEELLLERAEFFQRHPHSRRNDCNNSALPGLWSLNPHRTQPATSSGISGVHQDPRQAAALV